MHLSRLDQAYTFKRNSNENNDKMLCNTIYGRLKARKRMCVRIKTHKHTWCVVFYSKRECDVCLLLWFQQRLSESNTVYSTAAQVVFVREPRHFLEYVFIKRRCDPSPCGFSHSPARTVEQCLQSSPPHPPTSSLDSSSCPVCPTSYLVKSVFPPSSLPECTLMEMCLY